MWMRPVHIGSQYLAANVDANGEPFDGAQLTVSGPEAALVGVALAPATADHLVQAGAVTLAGDSGALKEFAELVDQFDPNFSIVTP